MAFVFIISVKNRISLSIRVYKIYIYIYIYMYITVERLTPLAVRQMPSRELEELRFVHGHSCRASWFRRGNSQNSRV